MKKEKQLKKNNGKQLLLAVISCLLFISPLHSRAVGVAVYPAEVAMKAVVGETTTVRIKVSNPSTDVAVFEVYPDDLTRIIRAVPSSFTLESGAEQHVVLEVTASESGQLSTLLSVVGRPLASNAFQAGSGVKVPVTITAVAGTNGFASALAVIGTSPWAGAAALALLGGWLAYRREKNKLPVV